jgi:LPS-assembly lipoprotein
MALIKNISSRQWHFGKIFSVVLLLGLITGCGFKLRGEYPLADELKTLYLSSVDIHGELSRKVKHQLKSSQIDVKSSYHADLPELRILKDKLDRRTLSLFENGQVAEYELIYTVNYQVILNNREPLSFEFRLYRDYQEDPNRALAKSRELALLLSEMRSDAAVKILRTLATIQV